MDMEKLKIEVNTWLDEAFKDRGTYNKLIYNAMEYSIKIGGKRVRPLLMLYTYRIYKNDYQHIIPIAAAVEMIHTYSLIHDDLPCMDDDDLRRGKPTNHKVFGEAISVLAGDGLLNCAMSIMLNFCLNSTIKENSLEACSLIAQAAGVEGMIGGQVVDILSENKDISDEQLYYMHKHKTGELIRASIVSGAILADAPSEDIELLNKYGEKLGLIFQIKDDILDVIGDSNIMGKMSCSDENNNKITFVSKFGLDKCIDMCDELTQECLNLLGKISKDCTYLKDMTRYLTKREA